MAPTSDKHPTISIVIVTCNSSRHLRTCLNSLEHACCRFGTTTSCEWELIVIDNSSEDDSLKVVESEIPAATIIRNSNNRGFGRAVNQAAEVATGDWLLFVNPDVELDSEAAVNMIAALSEHKRAGVASARVRNADGSFQATCRNLPTPANILLSRGSILSRLFRSGNRYTLPDYDRMTEVPAMAGTVMMIRRELFKSVGGFDSRFFMFMEDTDLCRRLTLDGFVNLFVPIAGGVHHWGEGSTAGSWRRRRYHHLSVWKYFLKHHPNGFSVLLLPFLLVANLLVSVLISVGSQEESR